MKSEQYILIKKDLKSWAITCLIFVAPFAISELIQHLGHYDFGVWGDSISFALSSLLKLAQKYKQMNIYSNE